MSPQKVQAGNPQHHQGEADGQKNIFNAVRPVGVSNTFTLLDGLAYNTYNILRNNKIEAMSKMSTRILLPLHLIYFKTICSFMHDFVYNLTPPNISELLIYSSEKHYNFTRSSTAGRLYLNHAKTERMKNYFSGLDAGIWSSIPTCLRSLPMYKFKRLLYRQLLNIWMREDT